MDGTPENLGFSPAETALVLAQNDSGTLFAAIQQWWLACGADASFAKVVTTAPGPVELDNGLRLLGNEMFPKVQMPRFLIVSFEGEMVADFVMHALLRRALQEGATVWAVADALPQQLDQPDLKRAKGFRLVSPEYAVLAFQALAAQCDTPAQETAAPDPDAPR